MTDNASPSHLLFNAIKRGWQGFDDVTAVTVVPGSPQRRRGVGGDLVVLLAVLLAACRPASPLDASPELAPSAATTNATARALDTATVSVRVRAPSAPAAAESTTTVISATPTASVAPVGSAPVVAPPVADDPQNKARPPLESEDLTGQARRLFDAIKADDPALAADFFFPREPFIPLKDVKGAGKYWDQLHRVYETDIHQLHRKHASDWADAQFEGFALGSTPGWVKPGEEANKIGYFRTFNGKLRYRANGQPHTLDVRVIISWQGRWYITHLLPFKKH